LSWLIDNLLKGTLPDGFTESRTSLRYVMSICSLQSSLSCCQRQLFASFETIG